MIESSEVASSNNKYQKEKRERAIFTLKQRVKAGEVDPTVARVVLEKYLKEPEQTEDTYFADKLRDAQWIVNQLKNKPKKTTWDE